MVQAALWGRASGLFSIITPVTGRDADSSLATSTPVSGEYILVFLPFLLLQQLLQPQESELVFAKPPISSASRNNGSKYAEYDDDSAFLLFGLDVLTTNLPGALQPLVPVAGLWVLQLVVALGRFVSPNEERTSSSDTAGVIGGFGLFWCYRLEVV